MPELTREEKLKLVEKLPQQLQDLLYSEDTGAFLLYLGQKYNLPDEKVSLLSKLVADVVLKIVPITSLAQEINSKITSDAQAAMNLAQELYAELLAPVITAPSAPPVPATLTPTTPKTTPPTPPYQEGEKREAVDQYREPTFSMPEVVDLRKAPPAVSKVEPPPAPSLPPKPITVPPAPAPAPAPAPITPTPPLTFTRPVEPAAPLIEAEPHKIPSPTPKPQYIMRPSGLPPTDVPDNVLDLRKDRGEF